MINSFLPRASAKVRWVVGQGARERGQEEWYRFGEEAEGVGGRKRHGAWVYGTGLLINRCFVVSRRRKCPVAANAGYHLQSSLRLAATRERINAAEKSARSLISFDSRVSTIFASTFLFVMRRIARIEGELSR